MTYIGMRRRGGGPEGSRKKGGEEKERRIDRNLIEDVSLFPLFFSCRTKSGVLGGWGGGTKVCESSQASAWMKTLMLLRDGRPRAPQPEHAAARSAGLWSFVGPCVPPR